MKLLRMHGTGNTFLVFDAFREAMPHRGDLPELARTLCRRTSGFGTDGLLVVEPADGFAARMTVYNADGSVAEMCGNGLRCVGKLIADRSENGRKFVILTDAGPREVAVLSSHGDRSDVRISLGRPIFESERIPTTLAGNPPREALLSIADERGASALRDEPHQLVLPVTCLSLGNPHAVIFAADSETPNVETIGPLIERHPAFPNRTNVEFVTVVSPNTLRLRVWERGVGETAACGTGAAAAVVAAVLTGRAERRTTVQLRGGDLQIEWPEDDAEVLLTGEAVTMGEVEVARAS